MAGEAPPSQRVNRRVFAERVGCLCATLALSKAGASTRAELRVVTGGSVEFGREVARLMQRRFPNFMQGDDFQTLARIGNHISYYNGGDLIFLGPNLPHYGFTDRLSGSNSEVVVQMREDFMGTGFLKLPEMQLIVQLFERSKSGLSFYGKQKMKLVPDL